MLKLLKYEFLRRKKSLISLAIIVVILEALSIFLLYRKGDWQMLSFVLMMLMFVGVAVVVFFDTVSGYHKDLKRSQGTMLFMTPVKSNKIIASKLLFGLMYCIVGYAVVLLCGWFTNTMAVVAGYQGVAPFITQNLINELNLSSSQINDLIWIMVGFAILVLIQFFVSITTAITSITIGRTWLGRSKYNWFYAVLIFFGINIAFQFITSE